MSEETSRQFCKALQYIYDNIDEDLGLDGIAKHVGTSVPTLKRLFTEVADVSAGMMVRRLRMEYALRTLRSRKERILETALASGFHDHSAFSRSFRKIFGFSPKEARERKNIIQDLKSIELEDPDFIELNAFSIQSITEEGHYFDCAPRAWDKMKSILSGSLLLDEDSTVIFVGIGQDDPHEGEMRERKVRYTAGMHGAPPIPGLQRIDVKGGSYARFKFDGKIANIGLAYHYVFGPWREKSEVKLDTENPAIVLFETFPKPTGDIRLKLLVPTKESE